MTESFAALEQRPPAEREAALMAALPRQIAHAQQASVAFGEILAGVAAAGVTSRAALARLPVTRKSELLERQKARRAQDAMGGYAAVGWLGQPVASGAKRVFQSPGPIYEPEGWGPDYWRLARALNAAGFRRGELVHNSFSYHLTPAGSMLETAAHALGCTVFAGGVGNTELQLQAMVELRPQGYVGTPSFLKILVEKALEAGVDFSFVTKALVSGEAFPPSLRDWLRTHGIEGYQCYATADVGLVAYETAAREGLVTDEGVIVEIVRPGTGDPVPEGEVGEVVVTTLNPDYPLIRFGTGDLSAILSGPCPTGRTAPRLRGWLGRADQTTKVRGMFVHPSQVAEVLRRHPAALKARLVVEGEMASDRLSLQAEAAPDAPADLAERLAEAVRDITKLRATIVLVEPGSLPNDGKVIADLRSLQ